MKKTPLALILCLVLCVFAFASCDKAKNGKSTTAADTTVPDATTAHVHTPASEYTIDEEATCAYAGSKSFHCTVCNKIIPETVEEIPQLDHTPDSQITVFDEPTCADPGLQGYVCLVCGEIIEDTLEAIPANPDAHNVEVWSAGPTLLNPTVRVTGECTVCHKEQAKDETFRHDVKVFTTSSGKYTAGGATLGDIRGDKHFYEDGNDLLIEYSVLWNETLLGLNKGEIAAIDTRIASNKAGTTGNSGIVRWELADDLTSKWCTSKFAGAFEVAALETSEPDSPYPRFDTTIDDITAYPNIGGANLGDGQPLGDTRWGWHRVSIRYRNEVTNPLDVMAGGNATYKLQVWVYVDGVLILHNSGPDHQWKGSDRKLFSAAPDGAGGIAYTENDALYLHGAFLDSTKMASGTGYFEIADYSVTVGSDFVQDVKSVATPVPATLEVAEGVFIPSTMWYEAK